MKNRIISNTIQILSVLIFSGISLFFIGSLMGDVDVWGWVYIFIGAGLAVIFWYLIKKVEIHSNALIYVFKTLFFIFMVIGLLFAVYGGFGAITQTDLISKRRYDGMTGMLPWIVLFASLLMFGLSFLFRYLSKRKNNEKGK